MKEKNANVDPELTSTTSSSDSEGNPIKGQLYFSI